MKHTSECQQALVRVKCTITDELGDGAALHVHAGPDEGHLVGQILQAAGAQAPGDLELGG